MSPVFVDTSGFYAFLDGTDPNHSRAAAFFEGAAGQSTVCWTTNYVIHETWAVVQARLGWDAVEDWLRELLPLCEVRWVDQQLHLRGAARCRQARERRLSLTNAISIEFMLEEEIRDALAFDEHFAREGFRCRGAGEP